MNSRHSPRTERPTASMELSYESQLRPFSCWMCPFCTGSDLFFSTIPWADASGLFCDLEIQQVHECHDFYNAMDMSLWPRIIGYCWLGGYTPRRCSFWIMQFLVSSLTSTTTEQTFVLLEYITSIEHERQKTLGMQ